MPAEYQADLVDKPSKELFVKLLTRTREGSRVQRFPSKRLCKTNYKSQSRKTYQQ